MCRSLSQAKLLVSQSLPMFHLHRLVSISTHNNIFIPFRLTESYILNLPPVFSCRRGFAAASDVSARVSHGKFEEKPVSRDGQEACSAWVPDPETGYYRPINCTPKIDPVELRKMLLKHNTRSPN